MDGSTAPIGAHRAAGGRAVFLGRHGCVLADGSRETVLPDLRPLAARAELLPPEALLSAVAAAWALGIDADLITAGVQTFGPAPEAARMATPQGTAPERRTA
jgi:cyanophycin synthetase